MDLVVRPSWSEIHASLIGRAAQPSILINAEHELLHVSEHARQFLRLDGVLPSLNLLSLADARVRPELRAAIFLAAQAGEASVFCAVPWPVAGSLRSLTIRVSSGADLAPGAWLVSFEVQPLPETSAALGSPNAEVVHALELELERARRQLQSVIDEHLGSMTALQMSNEELEVLNAELHATTDELASTRGRLESFNAQLSTANRTLALSVDELLRVKSDLEDLMGATELAIVFLDRSLCIVHFTPAASTLFNFIASDVGRPVSHLEHRLQYAELLDDAQQVLRESHRVEREVFDRDGQAFLARLLPCRTSGQGIAGVVLTFVDITERQRAEELLRRGKEALEAAIQARTVELDLLNATLRQQLLDHQRNELARKELQKQLVVAQEQERGRISRELHDSVGQLLTGLMLGLRQLEMASQTTPSVSEKLGVLRDMAEQIGGEIHQLAVALRPTALDDLGLLGALTHHLEVWSSSSGISLDFHSSGLDRIRLPSHLETTIYRVAQEALNNVLKHAGASNVGVTLERRVEDVLFVVEDDGKGFDERETAEILGHRLGLAGMRERAALVAGSLIIESEGGGGTTVMLRIPLAKPVA